MFQCLHAALWFVMSVFFIGSSLQAKTVADQELQLAGLSQSISDEPSNSARLTKFCRKLDQRLSSVSLKDCLALQLQSANYKSELGSALAYKRRAPELAVTAEPEKAPVRVLLLGGVHGDELSSVTLVVRWLQLINENDRGYEWWVVPVLNPDGLFAQKPTRTNANGVDLNRNMPSADWQATALNYWKRRAKASKRKYPGAKAGSENESKWLISIIDEFDPKLIVSVHAPHNLVDYDAPARDRAPVNIGGIESSFLGTYPGSLGAFAGENNGIPVITLELANATKALSGAKTQKMWHDLLAWIDQNSEIESNRFSPNTSE